MKLVSRTEWKARLPKERTKGQLSGPSTGHWNGPDVTVGGQFTWDHSKCAGLVRGIQNYHMDGHGWDDIAYNFVECPHGYVFEGRGLNVVNAANGTNVGNHTSHAIMWLAGPHNPFTNIDKSTFRECVRYIADRASAQNKAIGHRDHHTTQCPGDSRYAWIHLGMPSIDRPLLKLGSRGDEVRWVQTVIRDHAGGDLFVDGVFGPHTEKRVKDVQRFFKLTADGIVGPKTWGILSFLAAS